MSIRFLEMPNNLIKSLVCHRELTWDLARRDFIGRYKGSMLGVIWSLFNPLFMLVVYTIVFSGAFKARGGIGEESKITFAIILFSGMIIHNLFAECLNRSPNLIISQPNYVKKVVFPLEIMPLVALLSALLHFLVSFCVLLIFCLLAGITIYPGVLLTPIIITPLVLMIMGLSWIFASLGVYLRDIAQVMGMLTTVALFLAPVFYPIESFPQAYRELLVWNPITLPIVQLRDQMFWNKPLLWGQWLFAFFIGVAVCWIGFWWFQKTRRGFADVL